MSTAPFNASLANVVNEKDLKKEKKHLDKVHIDKAHSTFTGGVHLGGGDKADFPPALTSAMEQSANIRNGASQSIITSNDNVNALRTGGVSSLSSTSAGGNQVIESGRSGQVSVQSDVVIDTVTESRPQAGQQIRALLSRLSTTTTQADDYARRKSDQISADANKQIQTVLARTAAEQDALLKDASVRAQEIEHEYAAKLKQFLQELDASKASNLAALERDLNFRQETLLSSARQEIDGIHQNAMAAKMTLLAQANAQVLGNVDQMTEQVKVLGEQEVERRMASTTTTIIETKTVTDASVADKTAITSTVGKTEQTIVSEPRLAPRI